MEPANELAALQVAADAVGAVSEPSLRRYLQGKAKFDAKFSGTLKSIGKERDRNLRLAHKEGDKSLGHLESYLRKVTEKSDCGEDVLDSPRFQKFTAGSWNWSWALDEDEHPPPSSIVSRRDTWEARQLAMIADIMPENTLSGNNLWQHLVTFLTVTPDKKLKMRTEREHPKPGVEGPMESNRASVEAQLARGISPPQTNGSVSWPQPLEHGSTSTPSRGWYWTRGSLWKERFKANHLPKGHKRVSSSASSVTRTPGTPRA